MNTIKVGDCVSVNFHGSQITLCRSAIVEGIPGSVGDDWIFRDNNTDQIHYVSEACTISKIDS